MITFLPLFKLLKLKKNSITASWLLKFLILKKVLRHSLRLFKLLILKKNSITFLWLKVFSTEKGHHHCHKVFNIKKGLHHVLTTPKVLILKRDSITSLRLLKVLILTWLHHIVMKVFQSNYARECWWTVTSKGCSSYHIYY